MKIRSHRWLIWLLPFLVARAFVPAGFMLSAGTDGLSLAFCPGVSAPLASAHHDASSQHHDHQHHAQEDSAGDHQEHANHFGASDTSVCPFAVAAATCAGADFHLANLAFNAVSNLLPSYTAPPDANRPIRADRIRGPPPAFT